MTRLKWSRLVCRDGKLRERMWKLAEFRKVQFAKLTKNWLKFAKIGTQKISHLKVYHFTKVNRNQFIPWSDDSSDVVWSVERDALLDRFSIPQEFVDEGLGVIQIVRCWPANHADALRVVQLEGLALDWHPYVAHLLLCKNFVKNLATIERWINSKN